MLSNKKINLCAPADGVISFWHKRSGDYVMYTEDLVEIEQSFDIIHNVIAPTNGILEILKPTGSSVKANQVIGTFEELGIATKVINKLKNFIRRKS